MDEQIEAGIETLLGEIWDEEEVTLEDRLAEYIINDGQIEFEDDEDYVERDEFIDQDEVEF